LDTLMQRVWPGIVVSPETVSQRIKLLRSALGDDPRAPNYIVGVRGRGYRLIARVERLDGAADASPSQSALDAESGAVAETSIPSAIATKRGTERWRRGWSLQIALIVTILALGGVAWRMTATSERSLGGADRAVMTPDLPPRSVAVLPFENLSGTASDGLLATGIADNVLHQLASRPDLQVTSRTSSFAAHAPGDDALALGSRLNARYLLEGSLQRAGPRLRVTAQLIDATTGRHVWSKRYDRMTQDVFAMQDEIAVEVATALESHLADGLRGISPTGTQNLDAWLAYQQGRDAASTRRKADLLRAQERFAAAIREDPQFAAAYVRLAEARILLAFNDLSESWFINSPQLEDADRVEIETLLARAIELDPNDGDAYIVRAWLVADPVAAAADYRRGLELRPNSAEGLERLARVLFFFPDPQGRIWDPQKREEAFTLVDRADEIDPLAPTILLTKALMTLYARSDVAGANAFFRQALEQDPNFFPALAYLGGMRWCCEGKFAEGAKYLEDALAIEPTAAWTRHFLIRAYLDMGDIAAAEELAAELDVRDGPGRVALALARGDVREAQRLASMSFAPVTGLNASMLTNALMLAAVRIGQVEPSRESLERRIGLHWDASGAPTFSDRSHDKANVVALGAVYMLEGDRDRGRRLIEAAVQQIMREAHEDGRGEMWYAGTLPAALAWLGDGDAAIAALQRSFASGAHNNWWHRLEYEPAFDELRQDPRFEAMLSEERNRADAQRDLLEGMRRRGEVPRRGERVTAADIKP
ncbi:MAG TPA: tetratricopeptide repeat protein, partial [Steroidobacteraceae bacterium]|nr:tetratricopeptide repeat protein [Steroidobacteraceae bacterium]